jgi:exosome complex RNA-binding protein Rrp4
MAIRLVEREAHTTGLTDRVHAMLVEEKSKRG